MVQFLPFLKLKSGPIFFFFVFFLFSKISFSLQKEEDFWKISQKTTKTQFLTLEFCYCFCFFLGGAETPIFIVFSAKMQNWKKHRKETKTLFVNTTVLTAFVKMSVFFFCIFHFCCFSNFHFFRDVFWQVSKNQKTTK